MGAPSARLLLRSRRRINYRIAIRPSSRGYASLDTEAHGDARLHDPTPSELLRAALSTSTATITSNEWPSRLHQQTIELLDREWDLGSPPPALWCALKGVHPMYPTEDLRRLRSAADLAAVRHAAEKLAISKGGAVKLQGGDCETLRQALQRCERDSTYAQIVSTLRDIIARLQRLNLPIQPQLFELAAYYAALDLSPVALRQFLQAYGERASSQATSGVNSLVFHALLEAINSKLSEAPQYDTSHLLAELADEGRSAPQNRPTLHDTLLGTPNQNRMNWSLYLCILAKLQSERTLGILWNRYLRGLKNQGEGAYHSAYNVIIALIQAGRSNRAVNFLEHISRRSEDNLPYMFSFRNLQLLIDDPIVGEALPDLARRHHTQLFETCLNDIERRLGIRWEEPQVAEKHGAHISVALDSSWAVFKDQPLLTIDGDSAGYDDPARLYPELEARGCSSSVDDLGHLVHLLNDQSGNVQEIVPNIDFDRKRRDEIRTKFPSLELRWCPEHSPIEFSDSPLSALIDHTPEWTPASLGLIRARSMINGVPQGGTKCLHLMQLGSMDMRHGPSDPWQPSGYIVAWDRQHGEMIALFVGKNYGLVDRGPTPPGSPFGAAMHLRPSNMPNALPLNSNRLPRDSVGPYYLDLDPSADLNFR